MGQTLLNLLGGYSKAMYSTWFYYRPDHLLLDAGEGVASTLDNRVFGIQRVLLSHGHLDHLSGLPTLVHIRNAGMGEKTKPLEVYYPAGDGYVQWLREYIIRSVPQLEFELTWISLAPGDRLPLTRGGTHGRVLEVFATHHVPGRLTLGFHVLERRRRLRPEYQGRSEEEIRTLVQKLGQAAIMEEYEQKLLTYCGDSMPVSPEEVQGTEILMHEATFLEVADRERKVHATLVEALAVAALARVKTLVLYHISSRYPRRLVRKRIQERCRAAGLEIPVWWVWQDRWELVEIAGEGKEAPERI